MCTCACVSIHMRPATQQLHGGASKTSLLLLLYKIINNLVFQIFYWTSTT